MSYLKFFVILVFMSFVSACATYTYDGKAFQNQEDAFTAQKETLDKLRNEFKPRKMPLAKYAKVVIPNKNIIMERLTKGGNQTGRDYIATLLYNDFRNTGEIIRTRNIFENLDIIDSADGNHINPQQGEAVIYIYICRITKQ